MGHSETPLYIIGSALAAVLLIVGFNTALKINDSHHQGQPADGYTLPVSDGTKTAVAPAPAKTDTAAPVATTNADTPAAEAAAPTTAEATTAAPAAAGTGGSGDIATLVASGDVAKGKKLFKRCAACHSYKKGEPSRTGPNLYGLVDRDLASLPDYADKYSAAIKAKGGKWTLAELDAFIKKPKTALPGTAMIFAGIKKDKKRADLLAYIKTLSD